jgi:hypothetical protein
LAAIFWFGGENRRPTVRCFPADFPIALIAFKHRLFQAKYGNLICFSNTSFHLLELCHEALGIFDLHLAANGRADLGATAGIVAT